MFCNNVAPASMSPPCRRAGLESWIIGLCLILWRLAGQFLSTIGDRDPNLLAFETLASQLHGWNTRYSGPSLGKSRWIVRRDSAASLSGARSAHCTISPIPWRRNMSVELIGLSSRNRMTLPDLPAVISPEKFGASSQRGHRPKLPLPDQPGRQSVGSVGSGGQERHFRQRVAGQACDFEGLRHAGLRRQ